jgi:hypothetical protein
MMQGNQPMNPAQQVLRLALLGAINHQVTHICVRGSIFQDARQRCGEIHPKLGQLVTCPLCYGTWVGFLMALVFRPKVIEAAQAGQPIPQPRRVRKLAAFFADAFAIALAGRFFTEVLAILAHQAGLKERQDDLLAATLDQMQATTIMSGLLERAQDGTSAAKTLV